MATIFTDRTDFNITDYSVQEDATPLDPSDTTGGIGLIEFGVREVPGADGSVQLQGTDIELDDAYRGSTVGTIAEASGENGIASVSADARLGALVGAVSAKPMVDTLQSVVLYYLSLANITEGIYIDPDIAFLPVAVPGFEDDLWLRLKQLASVHGCEVSLVSNKIVVRPIRNFQADTSDETDFSWKYEKGDAAQFVEVTYYGNEWQERTIVYPFTDEERANHQTWEIADGAVIEDDLELSVSVASIEQPVVVDSVPSDYGLESETSSNALQSVYSVYDSDNKPVTAQNWRNGGGKIELTINPDTTSIHVKITAPKYANGLTYRIVGQNYTVTNATKDTPSSQEGTDYSSLFIKGSGVWTHPTVLRVPTGVTPTVSVNEVGSTIRIPAVATIEDAYRVAIVAAARWSSVKATLSGSLTSVSQIGSSGSIKFRTLGEFNADLAGVSFGGFDTAWGGKTFKAFNDYEYSLVQDMFANQVFGNVAGARMLRNDTWYRITRATITADTIDYDATADTTIKDFNSGFSGTTFADFNTRLSGKTFRQQNRAPLATTISTRPIIVPPVLSNYPDQFYPDQQYPA